jgi:hypothetical protein
MRADRNILFLTKIPPTVLGCGAYRIHAAAGKLGRPQVSCQENFMEIKMLSIKAPGAQHIRAYPSFSQLPRTSDMNDSSIKVQDVIHLDKVDFEHENGYAGDRIADEKKLLKKIDLRMMPMMMLICMYVLLSGFHISPD